MTRCTMVNSIFLIVGVGQYLTFFGPTLALRGFIARIIRLIDCQLSHGRAFQMRHQGLIFKTQRAYGNFLT